VLLLQSWWLTHSRWKPWQHQQQWGGRQRPHRCWTLWQQQQQQHPQPQLSRLQLLLQPPLVLLLPALLLLLLQTVPGCGRCLFWP
jgi:hypothetical protein